MNTLRASQGIDTAFGITLAPASVNFATSPSLVAEIHRGDGSTPLATLAPTWQDTTADLVAVPFPGATSEAVGPGNYFLTTRLADHSAWLSQDALVIYPGTSGTSPIRSLIDPASALGVIPEFKADLSQLDGLQWLLEAATEACEDYVGRALYPTGFDEIWNYVDETVELRSYPVQTLAIRSVPVVALTLIGPASARWARVEAVAISRTNIGIAALKLSSSSGAPATLTVANYSTLADLAAAAILAGWTATVTAGWGSASPADLAASSYGGSVIHGATGTGAQFAAFSQDVTGFSMTPKGRVQFAPMIGWGWQYGSLRFTYRAGYDPVPKPLQTAALMVALGIRESAKTAGPVQQQSYAGRFYSKFLSEGAISAPARAILDAYIDEWAVV